MKMREVLMMEKKARGPRRKVRGQKKLQKGILLRGKLLRVRLPKGMKLLHKTDHKMG